MGRSFPGAIHDQELVLEEKRLRNEGTDPARTEQPSQDGDEMDEKNGKIAHQRIVAGRRILRNLGRNNDSPASGEPHTDNLCKQNFMGICGAIGNIFDKAEPGAFQRHAISLVPCATTANSRLPSTSGPQNFIATYRA
jgi:hypothetical protein